MKTRAWYSVYRPGISTVIVNHRNTCRRCDIIAPSQSSESLCSPSRTRIPVLARSIRLLWGGRTKIPHLWRQILGLGVFINVSHSGLRLQVCNFWTKEVVWHPWRARRDQLWWGAPIHVTQGGSLPISMGCTTPSILRQIPTVKWQGWTLCQNCQTIDIW